LAEEVGCKLVSDEVEVDENGDEYEIETSTLDQLEHLVNMRAKQRSEVQRRKELLERAKELKVQESKHRKTIAGVKRRREALFQAADCDDEAAYRRLAEDQQQLFKMKKQRKAVTREIVAAIGTHGSEEDFAELLTPANMETLEPSWEAASAELDIEQSKLTELAGERGALRQEQRTLTEDRSLAERQLDLSMVEKQLIDARQTWREHATVNRVLERIRSEYEQNRQPETLAVASKYMHELTGGEYSRIWTPLADDVLLVENAAGESLGVDVLSRGTREQLFLSVRLALVQNFASRGIKLPMVLDDILVNFDAVRAQRAAKVLTDFAAGGHQILLYTCHEHMWQMFKSLDADCRRLPGRMGKALPEPEPVIEVTPEVVVEAIVEDEPELAPVVRSKPKKKRQPAPDIVETPAPEFYDYPFVEKIEEVVEEHVVAPTPMPISTPALVDPIPVHAAETVYEWTTPVELPRQQRSDALAYILDNEEGARTDERVYYNRAEYDRGRRDHLESRRA